MSFLTEQQTKELDGSLSEAVVKTRQGLGYITGWHAIQEANRIFGFGNWVKEIVTLDHIGTEPVKKGRKSGFKVAYLARVRFTVYNEHGEARSGEDTGYGDSMSYNDSEIENHENAAKEAVTDAMKRAMKDYGNKFGLALYDKERENVATEEEVEAEQEAARSRVTPEQRERILELREGLPEEQVKEVYADNNASDPDKIDPEGMIEALALLQEQLTDDEKEESDDE